MASEVDIANRALSKLGAARITSLTDNNKGARAMLARFDLLRDAELEAHPWRFAVVRTTLPALVSTPAYGYSYEYQRPTDDLRPLMVGGNAVNINTIGVQYRGSGPVDAEFEIIGQTIQTNIPAPLKYEYISRVEVSGNFPALFVEALASRLAMDACEELTQSATKYDRAEKHYTRAIREARRVNALYRPPHARTPGPFIQSRVGP